MRVVIKIWQVRQQAVYIKINRLFNKKRQLLQVFHAAAPLLKISLLEVSHTGKNTESWDQYLSQRQHSRLNKLLQGYISKKATGVYE